MTGGLDCDWASHGADMHSKMDRRQWMATGRNMMQDEGGDGSELRGDNKTKDCKYEQ